MCNLTRGRTEPCKDAVGGLKNVYMFDYIEAPFTITTGEATALNAGITSVFKYELRADGNLFAEAVVSDKNTGTTINTQTLTLALKKLNKETSLEVDLMAKGRPIIVIEDNMGNFRIAGESDGNDLTGSDINTGGGKADFNGYNLTFTAVETRLAPFLDESTSTALKALV